MTKENLGELTTEDLIKKKKQTSLATGMLAGILTVLLVVTIWQTINKGFTALLIVPFALLPTLFKSYKSIGNIDNELKSRNINS